MQNYTVYHLHTELSLLDSCTNFKLYVDRAKELGQTAICFTEHGNCYNWIEKKEYCEEQGIKYLHGVEVYLTKNYMNIQMSLMSGMNHILVVMKKKLKKNLVSS